MRGEKGRKRERGRDRGKRESKERGGITEVGGRRYNIERGDRKMGEV